MNEVLRIGCEYGSHRAIDPPDCMPQYAWKIDNSVDILYDNELLINVDTLNINSTSFYQIRTECQNDIETIKRKILNIVDTRGKLHNPVTGSGGMLIGNIEKIGEKLKNKININVNEKIATLVSLSLTPLKIYKINDINMDTGQVNIEGKAILFESGIFVKIPLDLPQNLTLAILDCAGVPAKTAELVKPKDNVLILGAGGRTGLLAMYETKKHLGKTGKIIAFGHTDESCKRIEKTGLADVIVQGDATDPLTSLKKIKKATNSLLADKTINCINVPGTEMTSILATKQKGTIFFANLATSFNVAALGAEGVGKDVDMLIYRGYVENHAEIAFQLLRENPDLRNILNQLILKRDD
ncbi:MAG: L-erythro-3,5-diaminohexanoate dehydrogenase [Thermosediminibacterales bacterium]|jgi:L-erythro-3,5-diaminohexanoate dehydrogenase|nr:L-erythro-3,5-diaminohexanoate dehydrogenase [Thermosediminibacterales bacterium]